MFTTIVVYSTIGNYIAVYTVVLLLVLCSTILLCLLITNAVYTDN